MADGGNVEFVEIDGPVVYLRWVGGWRLGLQLNEKGRKDSTLRVPAAWVTGCVVSFCCFSNCNACLVDSKSGCKQSWDRLPQNPACPAGWRGRAALARAHSQP